MIRSLISSSRLTNLYSLPSCKSISPVVTVSLLSTSDKSAIAEAPPPPARVDKSTVVPFAIVKILVEVSNDRVWLSVSVNIPAKSTVLPPVIASCVPFSNSV